MERTFTTSMAFTLQGSSDTAHSGTSLSQSSHHSIQAELLNDFISTRGEKIIIIGAEKYRAGVQSE